jgi:hypothetical protein
MVLPAIVSPNSQGQNQQPRRKPGVRQPTNLPLYLRGQGHVDPEDRQSADEEQPRRKKPAANGFSWQHLMGGNGSFIAFSISSWGCASLRPQRLHRVNLRRPPRGKPAGEATGNEERECHHGINPCVVGTSTVQQGFRVLCHREPNHNS